MTNRPRLYPNHQHQWTDADPELFTNSLVVCTVCGFQAPRNVAGLDGIAAQSKGDAIDIDITEPGAIAQFNRLLAAIPGGHIVNPQPEQETRADA